MDYKKKLRRRLYAYIIYMVMGIVMVCISLFGISKNEVVSSIGTVLAVMGIVRIIQYFVITRNEESVKKREIDETDELNVEIQMRARSVSVNVYLTLAAFAIIVLSLLNQILIAQIVAYMICAFLAIYAICYFIVKVQY